MDNFVDGMVEVFDVGSLRAFLRAKLGRRLAMICSSNLPLREICAMVDEAAERRGWRKELIEEARAEFPRRPDFQAVCDAELARLGAGKEGPSSGARINVPRLWNRILAGAILLLAAIWCALGPGARGFVWLGAMVAVLAMPLLGKVLDRPVHIARLAYKLTGWMGTPSATRSLLIIGSVAFVASLFFGFVEIDSVPPAATDFKFRRISDGATILTLSRGEQAVFVVWPWGRSLFVDANGYRQQRVSRTPYESL